MAAKAAATTRQEASLASQFMPILPADFLNFSDMILSAEPPFASQHHGFTATSPSPALAGEGRVGAVSANSDAVAQSLIVIASVSEAIHRAARKKAGLLRRFAPRNDGGAFVKADIASIRLLDHIGPCWGLGGSWGRRGLTYVAISRPNLRMRLCT
jgi:hypothetical protein